jgi:hypothetical protein
MAPGQLAALGGGALGHPGPFGVSCCEPQMQPMAAQLPPIAVGAQNRQVEPKAQP